jgi:carbon-monoxide dehydrogenase small subunit
VTDRIAIRIRVNGRDRSVDVLPHHTLLEALREDMRLTGTKECCLVGECGACTVLVDGRSVDSCLMLAAEADGLAVTTVEGLAPGRRPARPAPAGVPRHRSGPVRVLHPGPARLGARRCSRRRRTPSRAEVEEGLAGNLCRCAGYEQIIEAVLAAAAGGGREAMGATPSVGERSAVPDANVAPQ